jgi:hypothetical protein
MKVGELLHHFQFVKYFEIPYMTVVYKYGETFL